MKHLVTIIITFLSFQVQAQLVSDVLRYSYYEDFGTARSLSIGNAIAPLGGDFYTLSNNPAGIATYRFSEFTVSTGFRNFHVDSRLNNSATFSESEGDVVLNNVGMVIVHHAPQKKWRTVNMAIGYNRNTSLDRRAFYSGSSLGSITDRWLEEANALGTLDQLNDLSSGLAFDAGAILTEEANVDNGRYISDYLFAQDVPLQREELITSEGGMGEFSFGVGANYKDRFYVGASFGIPILNFDMRRTYKEVDDNEPGEDVEFFENLEYRERLSTSGGGINAKVGFTYLISQALRWSFHYETGSRLTVIDEFNNGLTYNFRDSDGNFINNNVNFPGDGGTLNFEYSMTTPYQLTTGLGFIIGNKGFLSAVVDYHDYGSMEFNFDPDLSSSADLAYERSLNQQIDTTFGSAFTFRIGGEVAVDDFRFRGGAVAKQRPYASDNGFDVGYSAGIGLRINRVFLDFAYRRFEERSTYQPYSVGNTEVYAEQDVNTIDAVNDFVLTFGVKF